MSKEFCEYLKDQLVAWAPVTVRSMFGGYGIYREGQIFAIIAEDTLYFKVDDINRAAYEAKASHPFIYEAKGRAITLSYWLVPLNIVEDPENLAEWAEAAYQAGIRAQKVQSRKKAR